MNRSLNRPQWKRLSCLKARIFAVNKLKSTLVTEAEGWFVFSEGEGVELASIFRESDSNDYVVLVALIIDSKDFGENGGHLWPSTSDFPGDGTRLQSFRHGEAPEEEREFKMLALFVHEVEPNRTTAVP